MPLESVTLLDPELVWEGRKGAGGCQRTPLSADNQHMMGDAAWKPEPGPGSRIRTDCAAEAV